MLGDYPAATMESQASLTAEQLQVVSRNSILSIPMNLMLGVSTFIIFRNEIEFPLLAAWLATLILSNMVRFGFAWRYANRTCEGPETRRALRLQALLMLTSGMIWSVVPGVMLDVTNAHAAYIFFILAGITAGATLQSGAYATGGTAFTIPIFGVLIGRLIWIGGEYGDVLAFDAVLYMLLVAHSARRSERSFARTVLLKTQATSLAASLDREHTASKAAAARFFQLANHDTLTGLANRASFASYLSQRLERARVRHEVFHLFLLDLDHFKSINDTLGHSTGDEILKEAARRLASTEDDEVVARLGGDEFALILSPSLCGSPAIADAADVIAGRILGKVSGAFQVGERSVSIGASMGVASFPDDGETAEDLLAHADLALYAAKDGGRHRWRRFDAGLLAEATMARDIEHDLPFALAHGSLQVVYQPQIALGDHKLIGLEALLRWNHPVYGCVPPPMVVAAARRIRKSELLSGFVLDQALRQIRRLDAEGLANIVVAINVSPNELDHSGLPELVRRSLAEHGVDPKQLEIEITEEAFAASDNALTTLAALSGMGVRLAIDDFGTGYSSIAYLRSMSVDRIKIDRSFVTGLADRAGDRILVQAIIGIGRSFGIEVLAEGVETVDDVLLLKAFGCGAVQGFHFGHPMTHTALSAWRAVHDARHASPDRDADHPPAADVPTVAASAA